jgi:hypothetical protein
LIGLQKSIGAITVADLLATKLAFEFDQPQPAIRFPAHYARAHGSVYRIARHHNIFGPEGTWQSTDGHNMAVGQSAFELIRDLDQRPKSELT